VSEILRPKLQEGWSALERAKGVEGSAPSPVAFLTFGAVLGTGGFRDPSTGQTMKTPAWDAAWSAVGQFFQDKGLSWVVAQAITGEEEARLGWEGVRQAFAPAHPFGTIDIGGATLEFAYGDPSKSELEVRAASVYTGQDATFHRYVNTEAFRVCFHPADVQLQSAKACERWMEDHVFGASPLRDVAQMAPISEVYATGAAWHGIFRNYPRTPEKGASAAWTLAQLRQLANKVCPMSEGQLEAFAPKAYPVVTKNGRACFDLSFAAAFLAAVTTGTDSARVLFGGEDAWARGASVSARYFNDCRP
jgi:hypothetical protein